MSLLAPPVVAPPRDGAVRPATATSGGTQSAEFSRTQWACIAALTVLAAMLRFRGLGDWPVWVDEAHTWRDATMPLGEFLEHSRRWYPTSYFLLRVLLDLGWLPGEGAGFLRLPFAIAGVATVPVLACYGRRLVGPAAAVLSASFLCLHPWHVYWSQNARAYALVVLFATVAVGEFWRGRQERSHGRQLRSLLWLLLASSCHLTSAVLLPVFGVVVVLGSERFDRRRTVPLLLILLSLLLVLQPLLDLVPPFRVFLDAKSLAEPSLQHFVETVAWYFRVPFLAAAAVGAWFVARDRSSGGALPLLVWAFAPIVLLAAVGCGMVKVTGRYALAALPAVLLLSAALSVRLGAAVAQGLRLRGRERMAAALALPLVLIADAASGTALYFRAQNGDRGRWDAAAVELQRLAADRSFVVHTTHEPVLLYYLQPGHYRGERDPRVDVRSIERIDVERAGGGRPAAGALYVRHVIEEARAKGRRALFAASLPELAEKDADGSLQGALRTECELAAVLPLWVGPRDESVYVWSAR